MDGEGREEGSRKGGKVLEGGKRERGKETRRKGEKEEGREGTERKKG